MDAVDFNAISDRGALEVLPAAHYHAAAARARKLHAEATTPRLKQYLRESIAKFEGLASKVQAESAPGVDKLHQSPRTAMAVIRTVRQPIRA
jgi:hypothetical protein